MSVKCVDTVVVRMYRIGTGDCFVLKFLSKKSVKFSMMIDCGSCKGDSALFNKYVQSISDFVSNKIDLLVITHEHLDHIIGFAKAQQLFESMEINHVWLAWTEDPTNNLAKELKKKYSKEVQALALAIQKMKLQLNISRKESKKEDDFYANEIYQSKQTFFDGVLDQLSLYANESEIQLAADGTSGEMKKAMDFITARITEKTGRPPFYCYPGKSVPELKGPDGVRFYVLGPPENEEFLKKEEIKGEVYQRKIVPIDECSFIAALASRDNEFKEISPFSDEYRLPDQAKIEYSNKMLNGENNRWRNIDYDWLTSAGQLAIRLERFMNNTCLALAIELECNGKVLLFPGDAQSGNWKSWHDPSLKWKITEGRVPRLVRAKDLLEQTVFYKVGHHLSHNGTASESGLELMTSEELVAFAPLDYNNILSGWKKTMPAPGLLKELIKRTKGRIFRIDDGLISDQEAIAEREKWSQEEASQFKLQYHIDDDYIEYIVQ